MFDIKKKQLSWGNETLTIETGKIANQADGAVLVSLGETSVLATAVMQKKAKEGIDFFPLTVNYREMTFAAGKIPGGYFKREGRSSEKEVLTSRLIDRPLRPLFPEGFVNETQVICTLLSHDMKNQPDVVALIAASAALAISGIPFEGPIAGARVGYINNEFVLNPQFGEDMLQSSLDLMIAGTSDSVLMVESEAKELDEKIMLEAVKFGHKAFQPVIALIQELAKEVGKEIWSVEKQNISELVAEIYTMCKADLKAAYLVKNKRDRNTQIDTIFTEVSTKLVAEKNINEQLIKTAFKEVTKNLVRKDIMLENNSRIDGRSFSQIRPIDTEIKVFPRLHGSALFTRGETQVFSAVTLGTSDDAQTIDSLEGDRKEHFMMHYNFLPYSVGEASPLRAPGRREIGHGKLAWRALNAVMPTLADFPYTVRVVAEITACNGSSSMGTICSASLSMMDAAVPLKAPVAGIAMGLVLEGDKHIILSDIMGDEDHLGDMDFKVAGTKSGITALQMDIKVKAITFDIMHSALTQAKEGRLHILDEMDKTIKNSKSELSEFAPTITTVTIPKDKIKDLIGTGGKVIRAICEESGAKIEIEDTGLVKVAAVNQHQKDKAIQMINEIIVEPEINKIYTGKVVSIVDFGAFVAFLGKKEGLVHISELAQERIEKVSDFIKEGDVVKVKLLAVDQRGKIKLSMKCVNQETGEDIQPKSNVAQSNAASSDENATDDFNKEEVKDKPKRNDREKHANKKPNNSKHNYNKEPKEEYSEEKNFNNDKNHNTGNRRKYFS
jgi:polyribonucleotide nucleotidyltransferase